MSCGPLLAGLASAVGDREDSSLGFTSSELGVQSSESIFVSFILRLLMAGVKGVSSGFTAALAPFTGSLDESAGIAGGDVGGGVRESSDPGLG